MRVADNMNYNQVINNLNKNRKEAADLQNQAATQKRVTKPSDDPAGTARVLSARSSITGYGQYEKSLNQARSFLEFSDQSLQELTDVLVRVKELALSQSNEAGANASTRRSIATEVEQLYKQAVQLANRQMGDRYLFGGFKTTEAPFDYSGKYKGDDGEQMIEVNKGAFIPMNMPGSKIFLGKGIVTRTMVDSEDGIPRSAEDIHQLQVETAQEKERTHNYKNPDTETQGPEMRGPASIDPKSHKTAVQKDGENIFSVIRQLHSGLVTNDTQTIQETIERVDEAFSQVVMARSQVGSRVATLANTLDALSRATIDSKTLASSIEDVNAYELFNEMGKNENTLKATMDSSGRLLKSSLLDFLR